MYDGGKTEELLFGDRAELENVDVGSGRKEVWGVDDGSEGDAMTMGEEGEEESRAVTPRHCLPSRLSLSRVSEWGMMSVST